MKMNAATAAPSGLGERVREARGDMSPEEFALKLGISTRTLLRIEREGRDAEAALLAAVCIIAGCDVAWLVTGKGRKPKARA
jgi:transcriptional regulator with XRE-family HTH domain